MPVAPNTLDAYGNVINGKIIPKIVFIKFTTELNFKDLTSYFPFNYFPDTFL